MLNCKVRLLLIMAKLLKPIQRELRIFSKVSVLRIQTHCRFKFYTGVDVYRAFVSSQCSSIRHSKCKIISYLAIYAGPSLQCFIVISLPKIASIFNVITPNFQNFPGGHAPRPP